MSPPPHLLALIRLRRAKVDFLLIGALALDNYAPEMSATYSTGDCDILLRPTRANLRRALRELERAGYALRVGEEPLVRPDALVLNRLLERRVTTTAEKDGSLPIDLLVDAKGFSFAQWWRSRAYFKAGGASIPCAALDHVLESKRQSGRDKDKALLALYEAGLKTRAAESRRPSRRRAK